MAAARRPTNAVHAGPERATDELADRGHDDEHDEQTHSIDPERRDVHAESGHGEEDRQQHQHAQALEAHVDLGEHVRRVLARHRCPEEEGPEDGRDAEPRGEQCRAEQPDQQERERVGPEMFVPSEQLRQQRPNHEEQRGDERRETAERDRHGEQRPGGGDREHDRREDPDGDIVDDRRGNEHTADPRLEQPSFIEDSGEDGKGAAGDRQAAEQDERQPVDGHRLRRAERGRHVVGRIDHERRQCPEQERCRHTGERHAHRRLALVGDDPRVELEADDEHEDDQPDRGDHLQIGLDVGGKQQRTRVARQQSEHRGSEDEAADHLADDRRLTGLGEQPADEPARGDDDGDAGENEQQHVVGAAGDRQGAHDEANPTLKRAPPVAVTRADQPVVLKVANA